MYTQTTLLPQERIAISGITLDQAKIVARSIFGDDRTHTYAPWHDHVGGRSIGCHCTHCGAVIVIVHPHAERLTDADAYIIIGDDHACEITALHEHVRSGLAASILRDIQL
jgi:hypothetical protein